ncbi:helix-turn-helix transcriptional regulator [Streptomyces sp. RK75]|uniref:helix-turn-helix transcriptional regulator n=2 Tax=unclassified Streptomyces TaxID=2593676 RepID=UPI001B38396C|nr:helix-turn-helix transcriptional regulator [Streptomyces sp. RK75]MBQ0862514.1 helix-turn-helix transcriptional regulator [Streptomyces sp. RK75]
MSKRQKGRKHRTVNRTPRPVGSAAPARATRATATRATVTSPAASGLTATGPTATDPAAAGGAPAARAEAPAPETAPAPRPAPAPAPAPKTETETAPPTGASTAAPESAPAAVSTPEAVSELFRTPARDGGLGQSAGRTWERVRAAGAAGTAVEELAAEVGYQERTVLKHLLGLAAHGLVEQYGPGRWRPVPDGAAETGADEARVPQRA